MAMSTWLCLSLVFLAAVVSTTTAAKNDNFFFTGETLSNDQSLNHGQYSFVMQGDCNLVLYKGGWQSNTANNGRNCVLSLNNKGTLTITSGSGSQVWSSRNSGATGEYVAVLHPAGKVVVYGPKVWTTKSFLTTTNINDTMANSNTLGNIPEVGNLLLSGQVLYGDGTLAGGALRLVMQGDCNLVLYNGGWQSNTASNGKDCFLRLDNYGGLRITDGVTYAKVWSNNVKKAQGNYVAVVNSRGDFSVYGPSLWSNNGVLVGDDDGIKMVV